MAVALWERDAPGAVVVRAEDDGSVWLMPRRITSAEVAAGR